MTYSSDDYLLIDPESGFCVADIKSLDEAEDAVAELELSCAEIKGQLAAAHDYYLENGCHKNYSWTRKAKTALAFKHAAIQRLKVVAARFRREQIKQEQHRHERELIEALRNHVGEDVFAAIVSSLRDRREAA
jgi:hypothetical protein